jgi:N-acetylmuramoyl-L-alanine amidase
MKTIFLDAGHHNADSGAVNAQLKITEAQLTKEVRNLLGEALRANGYKDTLLYDNDQDNLNQTIKRINENLTAEDLVISIHFNALTAKATGCETIIANNASIKESTIASTLNKVMADTLKLNNRGVKKESATARGRIGIVNTIPNAVLLEVCFISNTNDVASYNTNKAALVTNLAKAIIEFTK